MKRETKTLTTANGHEVIYKAWLTGREKREIQNIFLENLDIEAGKPSKIKGEMAIQAQDKTIQMTIISVDGKEEDVLNKVLDLPSTDFDQVVNALNGIDDKKK